MRAPKMRGDGNDEEAARKKRDVRIGRCENSGRVMLWPALQSHAAAGKTSPHIYKERLGRGARCTPFKRLKINGIFLSAALKIARNLFKTKRNSPSACAAVFDIYIVVWRGPVRPRAEIGLSENGRSFTRG